MAHDYAYDYVFRPHPRQRGGGDVHFRGGERYRGREIRSGEPGRDRMGMHDFSEHYGRYSGGSHYGYEYSPRSIEHRPAGQGGPIGFTRRFRPAPRRGRPRPHESGGGYGRQFSGRRRIAAAPSPPRARAAYELHRARTGQEPSDWDQEPARERQYRDRDRRPRRHRVRRRGRGPYGRSYWLNRGRR